jgi:hypothetical protein
VPVADYLSDSTLKNMRGPVRSEQEKTTIEAKATEIAGTGGP